MSKFRAVFREDGDSGEKRISDTPLQEQMMKKLHDFYKEWKDATDSTGTKLLPVQKQLVTYKLTLLHHVFLVFHPARELIETNVFIIS